MERSGVPFAKPSIYSRELCRVLYQHLTSKTIDHPLLLIGCYLNPLFREMEFISNERLRIDYRSKAEGFTRKLVRKRKQNLQNTKPLNHCIDLEETGPVDTNEDEILTTINYKNSCELHRVQKIGGKRRTFDLMDCADSKPPNVNSLDEISLYNLLVVDHLVEERQKFFE